MSELPNNETRTRILDAAEQLFANRGYAAVRLRDIAAAVQLRHASLYYYAPGGKEQLFMEVMQRSFRRHNQGLTQAIASAGEQLREQLYAVAEWLLLQPRMDIGRMYQSDLPEIDPQQAQQLMQDAYDAVRLPLVAALERARNAGFISEPDLDLAAMALLSLIESINAIPVDMPPATRRKLGLHLVDLLLDGLLKR